MPNATVPAAPLPRITIATICWNAAGTIRDTLESLKAQNYPNLEYLIIDGGSTDDTLKIVAEYPELNPVIDYGPDEGPNHAYQKAIDAAQGDLFGLLNADDILEPGALHAIAQSWLSNPVDMITIPVKIVSHDAQTGNAKILHFWEGEPLAPTLKNIARGRVATNAHFGRPSFLQSVRIQYKMPDGSRCTAADQDFYMRLTRQPFTHMELVQSPAYVFRQHEGSLTFNSNPHKQLALNVERRLIHRRFADEFYATLTWREYMLLLEMRLRHLRIKYKLEHKIRRLPK